MKTVPTSWHPCYRIIPSRFPPINLFERVADPKDLEVAFALDAQTNPRIREAIGQLHLVPDAERVSGPGTSYIMAAYTHPNPGGSRFSDGTFGVYYAGESLATAVAETVFHQVGHLRETHEPPQDLDMRVVLAELEGQLWDVRGSEFTHLQDPDPATYGAGQAVGRQAKVAGCDGVRFMSVRRAGGECAAVLRPKVLSAARQAQHLIYPWDGLTIHPERICVKTLL